eukprot:8244-Prorocentrum_lima.AAC.1
MTSSLVGSEMCIRDRIKIVDILKQCLVILSRLSKQRRPPVQDDGIQQACLLYTSDAADDM